MNTQENRNEFQPPSGVIAEGQSFGGPPMQSEGGPIVDHRKHPAPFHLRYNFTKDGKLVPILPKKQKPETRLRGWINGGAVAARHRALDIIGRENMKDWFDPRCPPAEVLAGCSMENLADHIQAQFEDGMTWDSWGRYGWQIDHIRPVASFDQRDIEEVKKCWHWSNLRPLWANLNLAKKNNYNGERPSYRAAYKGKTKVLHKAPTKRQIAEMVYKVVLNRCEKDHLRMQGAQEKL